MTNATESNLKCGGGFLWLVGAVRLTTAERISTAERRGAGWKSALLPHFANQHSQAFSKPFIIHHSPLLFRSPNSRVLPREMNGSMFWFQNTDPINLESRLEAINSVH